MKTLHFILGFLMIAFFAKAQVKQNSDGLYANADGTLFSGTLSLDENGIKKSTLEIKDGKLNGEAKYYYASGKLMETGTYETGLKSGKWIRYNEGGMMIGIAAYAAGKKDGTWIVYDDNGKKRFEMNYKNGEKTGVWNNWDENGAIVSTKDYGQMN